MKMRLYNVFVMTVIKCAICFLSNVSAVEYSRINEGYSQGYLRHCEGSWKTAVLKPKTLEGIYVSVLGSGRFKDAKWTSYNHHHIGNLAKHPNIDFRRKTFVYVPGYMETISMPSGRFLGMAYRNLNYNVLILEYISISARDFPLAARFMRPVAKHAAEMLVNLTSQGLDPKKLELVGTSLGGQTMSLIANNYRQITGKNVSSLTALDPSGPCFGDLDSDQRLDPSDADFVLKISTNINGFGSATPEGHVNFYVNGGEQQPGETWYLPCTVICSHIRSMFIWAAALENPRQFIGIQCDSVQQARDGECYDRTPISTNTLDLFTDRSKPGIYYVATTNKFPFALGEKGLDKFYRGNAANIYNYVNSYEQNFGSRLLLFTGQ